MTTQEIISMIGLLGIGAILRGIFDSFLKKKEKQPIKQSMNTEQYDIKQPSF